MGHSHRGALVVRLVELDSGPLGINGIRSSTLCVGRASFGGERRWLPFILRMGDSSTPLRMKGLAWAPWYASCLEARGESSTRRLA
ncbi:hypothetical protein MPNT_40046 [Candidatus Methylacidithermus pantelleriae]|uniref:Uncharacterized protein n=1 Tax=Candidatus Methylacidithermus pantelleriae TaxID=2744239 RepID=A0A8J2BPB9_9BACT|nr:hypothetical protein MPNT_40046 [Candidatus Methylacidithermus pantelleriae]